MSDIGFENVRQDCVFFRGSIPCVPNKQTGAVCTTCDVYRPVSKRILIIKLGALGDVIRTTPLVVKFRKEFPIATLPGLPNHPKYYPKTVSMSS